MALSIKDPEADRLARELAAATGETMTEAVVVSLRERMQRLRRQQRAPDRREKLRLLRQRVQELPVLDERSADEILGYDDAGLPG